MVGSLAFSADRSSAMSASAISSAATLADRLQTAAATFCTAAPAYDVRYLGAPTFAIGAATALMARRGVYEIDGAPLLDSYSLLVKLAEATVGYRALTGTYVSRKRLYQSPPAELSRRAAEIHNITSLLPR